MKLDAGKHDKTPRQPGGARIKFESRTGNGALFRNQRKETDRHPDYNGSIVLPDGTEHWLSGWLKEGKQGKFLSLALGDPKQSKVQRQLEAGKRLHGRAGS